MSTPCPHAGTDRAPPLAVLIVDDELFARTRLRTLVQACAEPRCVVAGEAADGASALQWLRDNRCDVVLLDVAMPGLDGLHLADELHHQPQPPAVVFVTAHGEHALRAFELEATDYLTKPVRRERLQAALLRVAQRLRPRAANGDAVPMLVVSDRGRVLRIPATEVLYLKAELKYVTLRTADGELGARRGAGRPRAAPGRRASSACTATRWWRAVRCVPWRAMPRRKSRSVGRWCSPTASSFLFHAGS